MNIVQITAGAGGMYCGICFRDNAVVAALRKMGHNVLMVPLYLPLTLDEPDQSAGTPIFFSGINVYLEQKSAFFRAAPNWLRQMLGSRSLLKWVGTKTARTQPKDLGDLTLSMLRGEDGFQVRELNELIAWLKQQPKPDVICLSNALLVGLTRKLKQELGAPIVCMLQGEDAYLDALPAAYRDLCWEALSDRAKDVSRFGAASRYFGNLMRGRLELPSDQVRVVYSGINLDGYDQPAAAKPLTLGFFARMCPDKGLDILVDAYLLLLKRGRLKDLKLKIGGGCGPTDEAFVNGLREKLEDAHAPVEFHPNLDRPAKIEFLRSLSLFSVPARSREAFGMYVIEALAAGVPVVQPRAGAFPEIIEATGGGILCEPENPASLADALESLLLAPDRIRALADGGRRAIHEKFSAEAMAASTLEFFQTALASKC